ncbi:hypothetical protein PoB_007156400 [Plakobranchus ocellatus]|uniref:Uncharacterized protein n=1 Tax=Plakobranchus ocellatus TaxID=259542 RepID=A0AAV4DM33_9GAST|nr:hypothetical protein PoB_007156400 [Plakobranchus ocellatus]
MCKKEKLGLVETPLWHKYKEKGGRHVDTDIAQQRIRRKGLTKKVHSAYAKLFWASVVNKFGLLYKASPQQGDLRLLGPPPGRGAHGGAGTRDRRIPACLRADSLSTMPPMSPVV